MHGYPVCPGAASAPTEEPATVMPLSGPTGGNRSPCRQPLSPAGLMARRGSQIATRRATARISGESPRALRQAAFLLSFSLAGSQACGSDAYPPCCHQGLPGTRSPCRRRKRPQMATHVALQGSPQGNPFALLLGNSPPWCGRQPK